MNRKNAGSLWPADSVVNNSHEKQGWAIFDENKLYLTDDPALAALGPYSTLAHWRSEGRGPAFIKLGSRVAYSGRDLNEWLETRTVRPMSEGRQG